MIRRCNDRHHISYKYYGARGIRVCDSWLQSFERFLFDMGPKPTRDHEINRIDNDGNYEPDNCEWLHKSLNRPLMTKQQRIG